MSHIARFRTGITSLSAGLVLPLALSGCMGGEIASTGTPLNPTERQEGAKAHPDLVAEFGGAETGPRADYVANVTRNVAVHSGLSNAPGDFTVTLLNSSVNNAFAIPGGYVYVTRQLVGLMNNEAELAGVMGHEVGHVAARHSARRQAQAQQNALLGVLGQVLSGVLLGDSALGKLGQEVATTVPQMATLRYSRTQELQADELGIQYLRNAGYDPRAMGTVLQSLAAQNALDAQLQGRDASMPEWSSTHPDPASRVQTALGKAGANAGGNTNRDVFLSRINGVMYGDDPKQGVVEGRTFTHPEFRLAFDAPQGFYMVNGTRAVSINGQSGRSQLSTAAYNGNLDSYIRTAFQALVGQGQTLAPTAIEKTTVNGIPAAYGIARVNTNSGQVDVVVYAYEFAGNRAYHFTTITAAGQSNALAPMYKSMRRISASQAAGITPRRVEVVTVRSGDTVAALAARMAFDDAKEARFRVLNGLGANDRVSAGQKVKLVVRTAS
ncbi:peptidase M48 family protein [Caenibius tardaugens NBRC 16725]|uniref:Peptidase M48 family protein n=1 Tax=Caenibius tardaugens NBRC 16725 TaxID=1219035 RepID=U3A0W5_9SPHN|nr:M48 family metalloprotease [Caenibius tardaugens]AZI34868.1 LysM peptidoglycan-binding domain-containing protein [Caenibius tardaugens NBRC 16725]GAD48398.1 peptidase M48 family protein [Caenibius tardaugens NBRC 16725]